MSKYNMFTAAKSFLEQRIFKICWSRVVADCSWPERQLLQLAHDLSDLRKEGFCKLAIWKTSGMSLNAMFKLKLPAADRIHWSASTIVIATMQLPTVVPQRASSGNVFFSSLLLQLKFVHLRSLHACFRKRKRNKSMRNVSLSRSRMNQLGKWALSQTNHQHRSMMHFQCKRCDSLKSGRAACVMQMFFREAGIDLLHMSCWYAACTYEFWTWLYREIIIVFCCDCDQIRYSRG